MESLDCIPLDQWVQLPAAFEGPEYVPDYIAVAAEECSGSYSQGSSSPETFISATDDTNLDLLEDLPHLNEDVAQELVNDLVYEDPAFGSVLIDSDISDIFKEERNAYGDTSIEIINDRVLHDPPTRRKQRIVPMTFEPFDCHQTYTFNKLGQQTNEVSSRKRSMENTDVKYPLIKLVRSVPVSSILTNVLEDHDAQQHKKNLMSMAANSKSQRTKNPDLMAPDATDMNTFNSGVRQRKRGLTLEERKERKKQSNRNASYRYRQRKKEEVDNFLQTSMDILKAFESEKEAYQNIVEEFIRCIKHARLVNDARGELKLEPISMA